MKNFIANLHNIRGINADAIENSSPESSDGELLSDSDSSNTSQSDNFSPIFEIDIFSITEWLEYFKLLPQPQSILVKIPKGVQELFISEVNIESVHTCPQFNTFTEEIESAIAKVGGTAFIKNNWHAPKDAAMFSLNHLLKVTDVSDVFTYMKFSDIIMKDFDNVMGDMNFVVNVRPWMDIHPASEFRCIVVNRQLAGITPREWPKYYAHYKDIRRDLINTMMVFFQSQIKLHFPTPHFIFDLVYTSPENYMFWDFGPLKESTKLYAFEWNEILYLMSAPNPNRPPVFRYLAADCGILPSNISYQQHRD